MDVKTTYSLGDSVWVVDKRSYTGQWCIDGPLYVHAITLSVEQADGGPRISAQYSVGSGSGATVFREELLFVSAEEAQMKADEKNRRDDVQRRLLAESAGKGTIN